MKMYYIHAVLEGTDWVEANSPEEAFEILSDAMMSGWEWDYHVIDEEEIE